MSSGQGHEPAGSSFPLRGQRTWETSYRSLILPWGETRSGRPRRGYAAGMEPAEWGPGGPKRVPCMVGAYDREAFARSLGQVVDAFVAAWTCLASQERSDRCSVGAVVASHSSRSKSSSASMSSTSSRDQPVTSTAGSVGGGTVSPVMGPTCSEGFGADAST